MIKMIGCLLIIAATTLFGVRSAGRIKEQYSQMRYLREILYMLRSEIRYTRSYMGEAFRVLGRRMKAPYAGWLVWLADEMEKKEGHTFAWIWEEGIRTHLTGTSLGEPELERLKNLGLQLGTADIDMQTKALDLYLEQLAYTMEELREGMNTKVRLCHCLGVMSGIFIAVLFI